MIPDDSITNNSSSSRLLIRVLRKSINIRERIPRAHVAAVIVCAGAVIPGGFVFHRAIGGDVARQRTVLPRWVVGGLHVVENVSAAHLERFENVSATHLERWDRAPTSTLQGLHAQYHVLVPTYDEDCGHTTVWCRIY